MHEWVQNHSHATTAQCDGGKGYRTISNMRQMGHRDQVGFDYGQ